MKDRFCLLPFTLLHYRPNGTTATCSQGLKQLGPTERLDSNTFDEVWNSEFMREFRMAKLNNEYVENCYSCYFDDAQGYDSKRKWYLDKYYDDYKDVAERAKENNGYVDTVPWHWEIRISNTCNAQCVMCGPLNSSKIASEIHNNLDNNLLPVQIKNVYNFYKETYSSSITHDTFIEHLWNNLESVRLLEIHGGEPWADPAVVKLLNDISKTSYASQISIKTFSNCTLLTEEKIDVLYKFKGGTFVCSVDAYGEEAEYVRYPLKWDETKQGMELVLKHLNDNWEVRTLTVSHLFNIWNLDTLFDFLLTYDRLVLIHSTVSRPRYLSPDLLAPNARMEVAKKFKRFKSNSRMETIANDIITHIGVSDDVLAERDSKLFYATFREEQLKKFRGYCSYLDNVRNFNTLEVFPHLNNL